MCADQEKPFWTGRERHRDTPRTPQGFVMGATSPTVPSGVWAAHKARQKWDVGKDVALPFLCWGNGKLRVSLGSSV